MVIQVFQTATCPVTTLNLTLDIRASLAKLVIRYRMTTLSWMLGWIVLVLHAQLAPLDVIASPNGDHTLGNPLTVTEAMNTVAAIPLLSTLGLLTLLGVVQSGVSSHLDSQSWLLGTDQLWIFPTIPAIALWAFGFVALTLRFVSYLTSICQRLLSRSVQLQL